MSAPPGRVDCARLPGICPDAAALVALTRPSGPAAWRDVARDPGGVLLVLRHGLRSDEGPPRPSFSPSCLHHPAILDAALGLLGDGAASWVDWQHPGFRPLIDAARSVARLAARIATQTNRCDPEIARAAGLLAPLGWFALANVEPSLVEASLSDPTNPQARRELDHAGIARRLARRWFLPTWLGAVVGHLNLPVGTAVALGADAELFAAVQLAAGLAEREGPVLGLVPGADLDASANLLGLTRADLRAIVERDAAEAETFPEQPSQDPRRVPLLPDLLRATLENRRAASAAVLERLEREVDRLHGAVVEQRAGEEGRLRRAKLAAVAEFAAGAGHEINNPLAVISGQAQYLMPHEGDEKRQRALQSIVRQAHRIHQILHELMQFARPSEPLRQPIDVAGVVRDAVSELREPAEQRRITLECCEADQPLPLVGDARQLQTAVTCLVRNAVEAAPDEGWVRVRLETPQRGWLEVAVEDSGPGPNPAQSEHLFDPFYSGRSAGRGRGLGLPTAWRLAREHGGDVAYAPLPGGPTRFVLRLPLVRSDEAPPAAA